VLTESCAKERALPDDAKKGSFHHSMFLGEDARSSLAIRSDNLAIK
jgi:hypothetical protein